MSDRVGIREISTGAVLVGMNLWLTHASFEPLERDGAIAYGLVTPSLTQLFLWIGGSGTALLTFHALLVWRRSEDRCFLSRDNTRYLRHLWWMTLTLVPLANLLGPASGRLPALGYVLFDLRWYWWALIFVAAVRTIGPPDKLGHWWRGPSERWRIPALVVISLGVAGLSTPHLRFSGALHGDEPKYLRYCESFYQGRGFNIADNRRLADLGDDDGPRVLDNLRLLVRAVPEEAALLAADARRFLGESTSPRLVGGEPTPGMFFEGKHPDTWYQLHNPGLSFLLFPGYYIDRRLTGRGVGYQGEFPAELPAVHITLLALYAGYGLALYALLRRWAARAAHAWGLALIGVMALPVGAFAFQIYPETAAGIIIFLLVRHLMALDASRAGTSLVYGALAGFLPWLHVRFGLVTLTALAWVTLTARPGRTRLWFASGAVLLVVALSLYTYRLTGSLLPVATYGSEAPVALAKVAHGVPAFFFDRDWGLLPHAPIYLLALPGVVFTWRRRPQVAYLLGAFIAAVVVPAAGHGYWAGGGTPGRYLVAVAPLLLLFAADAIGARSRGRAFGAALVIIVILSLDTALQYNTYHRKHFGPLVAEGFAGWRPNLLFPSLGGGDWAATSRDVWLLIGWNVVAGALLIPWSRWRTPRDEPQGSMQWPEPRLVCVGLLAIVGLAHVGAWTGGDRVLSRYLAPYQQARERLFEAFVRLPRCTVCYFSGRGTMTPTDALGNNVTFLDVRVDSRSPQAEFPVLLRIRPRDATGEYVLGTLVVDFGDGTGISRRRQFRDILVSHVYAEAGEYEIRAWFTSTEGEAMADVTLLIGSP